MNKYYPMFIRLLDSAVRNISNSFYDQYVEVNTKFRARAGLKQIVIRRQLWKCCDWCSKLAGTYEYGREPKDVWRRHQNCKCIVTTQTERGTYQDAWSRKEYDSQRDARAAREEEILRNMQSQRQYRSVRNETTYNAYFQSGGRQTAGKHYKPYDANDKRDQLAAKEYRKISRNNDINRISQVSGLSEDEVKQIKRHIFFEKHKLYERYGLVDPDYDIAVAWKRLNNGAPEERDLLLLQHELLESQLEKEYNLTLSEAHRRANLVYNWEQRILNELGVNGEPDGLL